MAYGSKSKSENLSFSDLLKLIETDSIDTVDLNKYGDIIYNNGDQIIELYSKRYYRSLLKKMHKGGKERLIERWLGR